MIKRLLILGAGGHGGVVKEIAETLGQFEVIDFLDDASAVAIGRMDQLSEFKEIYSHAFPAVGNNEMRLRMIELIGLQGFNMPILIHPTAFVSPSALIQKGTVVEAMAMINTNARIGMGCIIDMGAIVDHDSVIADGCHIDCGAIVKAHCQIKSSVKVHSGHVIDRD